MELEGEETRSESATVVDVDTSETQEWLDSLHSVATTWGPERALYLIKRLEEYGQQLGLLPKVPPFGLPQYDSGRASAGLSWRHRAGSPPNVDPAVERPCDGNASERCLWRSRRAHRKLRVGS